MCIICNMQRDDLGFDAAEDFLSSHYRAGKTMREASDAMLKCSKLAINKEDKKRYAMIHKKMVKMRRAWNALEQLREKELKQNL